MTTEKITIDLAPFLTNTEIDTWRFSQLRPVNRYLEENLPNFDKIKAMVPDEIEMEAALSQGDTMTERFGHFRRVYQTSSQTDAIRIIFQLRFTGKGHYQTAEKIANALDIDMSSEKLQALDISLEKVTPLHSAVTVTVSTLSTPIVRGRIINHVPVELTEEQIDTILNRFASRIVDLDGDTEDIVAWLKRKFDIKPIKSDPKNRKIFSPQKSIVSLYQQIDTMLGIETAFDHSVSDFHVLPDKLQKEIQTYL